MRFCTELYCRPCDGMTVVQTESTKTIGFFVLRLTDTLRPTFPRRPAPLRPEHSKNSNFVRRLNSPHRCLHELLQHRGTLFTGRKLGETSPEPRIRQRQHRYANLPYPEATKPQPNVDSVKLIGRSGEAGHYGDQSVTSAKWLNPSASHSLPLKHEVGRTSRYIKRYD